MINLYFGSPCDDWAKETADLMAINHNVSMERAIHIIMKSLLESMSNTGKDGYSYIDDRFGWTYEQLVFAPKIVLKSYLNNGYSYPMMALTKNFLTHRKTGVRLPITDRALTIFGEEFEKEFGIEYLGHKWGGKQRLLNAKQADLI